jgi:hypothetical protein
MARYARAHSRTHHGMVLTAPKTATFGVSAALAALALLLHYDVIAIAALGAYAFPMLALAFLILAIGCAARGM